MKKRIFGICTVLLLCAALCLPALAATYPAGIDESLPHVMNNARLLQSVPVEALDARARELGEQYQMDIVIVTRRGLGGKTPMEYADDFFDYEGYGWREEASDDIKTGSGILLLLDMAERDIWISTKGRGMTVFHSGRVNRIIEAVTPELGSGQYRAAFSRFLDEAEKYLEAYTAGGAATTVPYVGKYPAGIAEELPRVADNAGLLSSEEAEELEFYARGLIERFNMDLVVVTAHGLDGKTPMDYADDFFDYGGYGWRETSTDDITTGDGMLLLIDMESYEFWISTKGRGMSVLPEHEIDALVDALTPELGEGLFFEAFLRFYDEAEARLAAYCEEHGYGGDDDYYSNYDPNYSYGSYFYFNWGLFIIVAIIGLIIALVVVNSMKKKHNTIRSAAAAQSYQQNFNLTERQDIFLYSNTTRVKIPDPPTYNSGGGHISSSGSSHGGGGGSFGGGHSSSSGSSHGGGGGKF